MNRAGIEDKPPDGRYDEATDRDEGVDRDIKCGITPTVFQSSVRPVPIGLRE